MSSHKITDASAAGVWSVLLNCMPSESSLPTFNMIKQLIIEHEELCCETIEICRNDCIAYWDTKNLPPEFAFKHSHRTKCPVCNEPRWVVDPVNKRTVNRTSCHMYTKLNILSCYIPIYITFCIQNVKEFTTHGTHTCIGAIEDCLPLPAGAVYSLSLHSTRLGASFVLRLRDPSGGAYRPLERLQG